MLALIKPFVQLCLLRLGPQDLPASVILMGIALAAHTLTSTAASLLVLPPFAALLAGIVGTALACFLTVAVLYIQHLPQRACQTLTAMTGAIAVLDVAGIPLLAWLESARHSGGDRATPTLLILLLIGWSIMVQGHILANALSTRPMFGVALAAFFAFVSFNVMHMLFPVPA